MAATANHGACVSDCLMNHDSSLMIGPAMTTIARQLVARFSFRVTRPRHRSPHHPPATTGDTLPRHVGRFATPYHPDILIQHCAPYDSCARAAGAHLLTMPDCCRYPVEQMQTGEYRMRPEFFAIQLFGAAISLAGVACLAALPLPDYRWYNRLAVVNLMGSGCCLFVLLDLWIHHPPDKVGFAIRWASRWVRWGWDFPWSPSFSNVSIRSESSIPRSTMRVCWFGGSNSCQLV